MDITSAEKWMHDLYTEVDGEKLNELKQWNIYWINTSDI